MTASTGEPLDQRDIDDRETPVERVNASDISDTPVRPPTAFPGAAIAGGVLGVVLLGGCGLLIRDLLAVAGVLDDDTWVHRAAVNLGTQTWSDWMWVVPAACAVVGLLLVLLAAKPRRRTHVNLTDYPVVWTRRIDVARRVSAAVSDLPDARHAVTSVTGRRVKVLVTATTAVDTDRVGRTARAAIGSAEVGQKIVVKVKKGVGE
ncbi:hypothetical protein [Gordonia shandongensis]|uniref:hypothetical protein n=1 Tax=Gordonia shandongensis TaxID=376351 RepID=UPI000428B98A|nr:hypothetical protein [Gordonia shandongensis]